MCTEACEVSVSPQLINYCLQVCQPANFVLRSGQENAVWAASCCAVGLA